MSGKKSVSSSDLAKVDAHVIQPEEYDEIPEWTDDMFDRAEFRVGGKLIRRGRPPKDHRKVSVTIRLDQDVLVRLRASGPGWQSRINDTLRKETGL